MNNFKALVDWLKHAITDNEQFHLGYADEASEFVRFNHAKVRQAGQVQQASLNLKLINDGRHADLASPWQASPSWTASVWPTACNSCVKPCRCCLRIRTCC